jgi:hypothetical protein
MTTKTKATVDDLYRVPEDGKAEISEWRVGPHATNAEPALPGWRIEVPEILAQ